MASRLFWTSNEHARVVRFAHRGFHDMDQADRVTTFTQHQPIDPSR